MAQNNSNLAELTALIEGIVAQTLSQSFGGQTATWAANNARTSLYLSRETGDRQGNGMYVAGDLSNVGRFLANESNKLDTFGGQLASVAGVVSAYQSGDAIGGAMSGYQLGQAFSFDPLIGAAIGLLAGLLSPGVDKWQRPKFKDAKQAFDKMFSMDRGERDQYYLPDSYYFRPGGQGPKKIVVKVGNNQFGDYIRESLTNEYESQLQRGLVF
jgi:hypothetical protein